MVQPVGIGRLVEKPEKLDVHADRVLGLLHAINRNHSALMHCILPALERI